MFEVIVDTILWYWLFLFSDTYVYLQEGWKVLKNIEQERIIITMAQDAKRDGKGRRKHKLMDYTIKTTTD